MFQLDLPIIRLLTFKSAYSTVGMCFAGNQKMKRLNLVIDLPTWKQLELVRSAIISRNVERDALSAPSERATYTAIVKRGIGALYREIVQPEDVI